MDKFNLNPCNACMKKCDPDDINCINNCCYETQGAFENAWSLNQFRNTPEAQNCVQCVNNSIIAMGRDNCDMRLTAAPIFNEVPHYFPEILNETADPEKSKDMCMAWCKNCRYTNECKDNCETDYNAVEKFKKDNKNDDKIKIKNDTDYRTTNPVSFYTGLILGSIFFIIIIVIFVNTIFLKK